MTNRDERYDRQAVLLDFKQRMLDFTEQEFYAPDVGIYDEPVRYLKINLQWFKFLAGMLSWLEDVAFWKEATDHTYIAIQEFLKFEEGIEPLLPTFPESGDCAAYLPSAPFIAYTPQNPYTDPDFTPPDYLVPPFHLNSDLAYPEALGYLATDVMTPISAINIDPINLATFNFPTIKIDVIGSGQLELDLLAIQQGGLAVIKAGSPPNILDIIGGIVGTGVQIVDLNNDTFAFPPESNVVVPEEINIAAGVGVLTSVYVVFIPTVDDAIIPLRYGGGLRGLSLCGFEEAATVGITDIRFNEGTCNLEVLNDGVWGVVSGWENWLDCVPSGGGGGGSANFKSTIYSFELPANQDTTSTTLVEAAGSNQAHTFTYPNALIIAQGQFLNTGGTNIAFEVRVNDVASSPQRLNRMGGAAGEVLHHTGNFEGITTGVSAQISMWFRAQPSGTARIGNGTQMRYTILEYANASDLYVEDVRIVGRELQKKIAGAWVTVTDSLATILNGIETLAINAQTTANSAVSVNSSQQTQINTATTTNNTQNTRLNALEASQATQDGQIDSLNIVTANHGTRIGALEVSMAVLDNQEFFYKEWSFLSSASGWSSPTASWVSGQGFVGSGAFRMQYAATTLNDNRVTHMKLFIRRMSGGFGTATIEWVNTPDFAVIRMSGGTLLNHEWVKVPNQTNQPNLADFLISNFSGEMRIEGIKLLGRGLNLFF